VEEIRNLTADGRTKRISAGAQKVWVMTLKGRRKQYVGKVCMGMPDMVFFFQTRDALGPALRTRP
jgi:hypothetical protein